MAKPAALVLCMAALCGVFNAAFLAPFNYPGQTIWDTLTLLSLATGICVASGMLFRQDANGRLLRTLPMQIFVWVTSVMLAMWLAAWYLETHCIFYRDVRRF